MKTFVSINAVSMENYFRTWSIVESFGERMKEATITLSKKAPLPAIGQEVIIKRGPVTGLEEYRFRGFVDEVNKDGPQWIAKCKDRLVKLLDAQVTYSYDSGVDVSAGVGSAIASDLIQTWGGMTASVVSTGITNIIKKFICNGVDVYSRLKVLCDIYDYQLYYNPTDDKVHFEPKGMDTFGSTIYIGGVNNNVLNLPKWEFDSSQMINRVVVKGAVQEVQDEQIFSGTGAASQIFTLAKIPIIVQAWELVTGTWVLKTPGVQGQINSNYHYWVDKERKKIYCNTTWTPASASNNVKIVYTNSLPVPIQVDDDTSQTQYGRVITTDRFYSDIQSFSDAEIRGRGLLNKYGQPFVKTKAKLSNAAAYQAGQRVVVEDSVSNESRSLLINKITYEYPYSGDNLDLGDKEWKLADWGTMEVERIKRLEEEVQKNIDLLTTLKDFSATINVRTRFIKASSQNIGNAFCIGHPVNGIIGQYNGVNGQPLVIGTGEGGEVDVIVLWPNNKYIENFHDATFKESTTTANWNTSTKQVTFS